LLTDAVVLPTISRAAPFTSTVYLSSSSASVPASDTLIAPRFAGVA
jgi:hypothetical protein